MTRISSLDLVRGLAAFVVAIAHYFVARQIGSAQAEVASVLAVEVFFVLSGFVLAPQILFCVRQARWETTTTFLVRRWLRTIPPYLVALTCATIVFQRHISLDSVRYAGYLQNVVAQHNTTDYYTVAWSLSVEEWFYVVFPSVLIVGGRSSRLRHVVGRCIAFVVAIFILRLLFADFTDWGASVRRVVVFRIDAIAYGFLLYLAVMHRPVLRRPLVASIMAAILLPVTALAVGPAAAGNEFAGHAFPFLAPALGASIVALGVATQGAVDRAKLGSVSVFLGRISYSVYLFHIIFVALLARLLPNMPVVWHLMIYVTSLVVFGAGFHRFFELPILDARPSYRHGSPSRDLSDRWTKSDRT